MKLNKYIPSKYKTLVHSLCTWGISIKKKIQTKGTKGVSSSDETGAENVTYIWKKGGKDVLAHNSFKRPLLTSQHHALTINKNEYVLYALIETCPWLKFWACPIITYIHFKAVTYGLHSIIYANFVDFNLWVVTLVLRKSSLMVPLGEFPFYGFGALRELVNLCALFSCVFIFWQFNPLIIWQLLIFDKSFCSHLVITYKWNWAFNDGFLVFAFLTD